jgi:hypothetical protein
MVNDKKKELLQTDLSLKQIEDIATRVHSYLSEQGLHASEEEREFFEGSPTLRRYYSVSENAEIDYHNATIYFASIRNRFEVCASNNNNSEKYFPGILKVVPELRDDYVNPEKLEDKVDDQPTGKDWKLSFIGPAKPVSDKGTSKEQGSYQLNPREQKRKKWNVKIESPEERKERLRKKVGELEEYIKNPAVIQRKF